MSRSGYSDDGDGESYSLAMWRGMIGSATNGKRGQRFFRDLVAALDEMPAKRLIVNELQTEEGEVCALGALGKRRALDMTAFDMEALIDDPDYRDLGAAFDIAPQLTQEVMYVNDELSRSRYERDPYGVNRRIDETPEERWTRVRKWAAKQIRVTPEELLPGPTVPSGGDGEREPKETSDAKE